MIVLSEVPGDAVVGIHVLGPMTREDERQIAETAGRMIDRCGRIRLLIQLDGTNGSRRGDLARCAQPTWRIDRLAIVAPAAVVAHLFGVLPSLATTSRTFDPSCIDEAWRWIRDGRREGAPGTPGTENVGGTPLAAC